jgi:mono/diheme cytochrome c family protein
MRHSRHAFAFGFLAGGITTVLLVVVVFVSGAVDFSATRGPGVMGRLGHVGWERSVAWRSPDVQNPLGDDPRAVAAGLDHYQDSCVLCHGAPGVPPAEFTSGMLPSPPDLTSPETQGRSDGELFHIIERGVHSSGMPPFGETHDEHAIWTIVSFVRGLDHLDPETRAALRERTESAHHGGAGHSHVSDSAK